jgi:hypothetical protein
MKDDLAFREFPISTISIIDLRLMGIKTGNLTEDDMKKICALVHDELKQDNALHNLIVKVSNYVIKNKSNQKNGE